MPETGNKCCEEPTEAAAIDEQVCCPPKSEEPCCSPAESQESPCCPPNETGAGCCPPQQEAPERAGYRIYPFVSDWLDTPAGKVPQVTSKLNWEDHRGRWAMRWGIGRDRYQVTPGIYAVGKPDSGSPVLVSANYKLSFDCLRSALVGENLWLLVIDTKGVNVWCAAGKGTFGTEEIIRRCRSTEQERLVSHRKLILPQLGAPGVAGFRVKQETGFQVIYGPVRASDLRVFLAAGMQASEEMRQVNFNIWERLVLTPVEVTMLRKPIFFATLLLLLLSGIGTDSFSFSTAWERGLASICAALVGVITGCILTPVLLPWIPTRAFAAKGALLGTISATILALGPYQGAGTGNLISLYLLVIAVASYTAMNFTGSTTFTSPSGVEKEMRIAIPCQALAVLTAGLVWIVAAF